MIYQGGDKALAAEYRYVSSRRMLATAAIYKGSRLTWEGVRSCYGKGYWIEEKPWIDEDKWRDNR